jgi:hypothetical protein
MAVIKGAIPWWSIPVNWTIGEYLPMLPSSDAEYDFGSFLRKPRWKFVLRSNLFEMSVCAHWLGLYCIDYRIQTMDC